MLDQDQKNVSFSPCCGKLGFAQRDEMALSIGATVVAETLSEFGHEVDQFQAKQTHRLTLETDHYRVEIRHRRRPSPMRQMDGSACCSQLELLLSPRFERATDQEISELLLARCLQNLVMALDVKIVEWLDTAIPIPADAFLGAFDIAPAPANPSAPDARLDTTTNAPEPIAIVSETAISRKRDKQPASGKLPQMSWTGKAQEQASPFAPIGVTLQSLSQVYNEHRSFLRRKNRYVSQEAELKRVFAPQLSVKSAFSRVVSAGASLLGSNSHLHER